MSDPSRTILRTLLPIALCSSMVFTLACGAKLPAVLSSTPDEVSVEFKEKDAVSSSRALAEKSCAKFSMVAEFEEVNATASGKTRVAKYKCVPPEGLRASDAAAKVEAARVEAEGKAEAARAAAEAVAEAQAASDAAQAAATSAASDMGDEAASSATDAATDTATDAAGSATDAASEAVGGAIPAN